MHAHEDVRLARNVALDHGDVVLAVHQRAEADGGELAERGRQDRLGHALDQALGALAVGDQVGHGDHLQLMALAVLDEVGHARHRPVVLHHLADDPGRVEPGKPGEVDGGLRLARALQHPSWASAEREDVTRLDEVARPFARVDRDLDRA